MIAPVSLTFQPSLTLATNSWASESASKDGKAPTLTIG